MSPPVYIEFDFVVNPTEYFVRNPEDGEVYFTIIPLPLLNGFEFRRPDDQGGTFAFAIHIEGIRFILAKVPSHIFEAPLPIQWFQMENGWGQVFHHPQLLFLTSNWQVHLEL